MTRRIQARECRHAEIVGRPGFTLVELLVAMSVLVLLSLVLVGMTNATSKIWRDSRTRITAFQDARGAFERMTFNLGQATLNTYLDYYDGPGGTGVSRTDLARSSGGVTSTAVINFKPKSYGRAADLQLVCGPSEQGSTALVPSNAGSGYRPSHAVFFTCPRGHVADDPSRDSFRNLSNLLNALGYYIDFSDENNSNSGTRPRFLNTAASSWRYRLMELNQPSEYLGVYNSSANGSQGGYSYSGSNSWYKQAVDPAAGPSAAPVYVVANNVIALVVRPETTNAAASLQSSATEIAPGYYYDTKQYAGNIGANTPAAQLSKNQLPPLVQVTLVAIDSTSALRLASQYNATPPPLVSSTMFSDVTRYADDLKTLEQTLQAGHYNYRIFTTEVAIPGAKWSQTQAQ